MSKINLFITKANDNLSTNEKVVEKSVRIAERYAFPRLKINWDIDLIARFIPKNSLNDADCVSGHTYESNLIVLYIEEGFKGYEISEVLVHELCHAARWGKNNELMNTLFDLLVFEGLAVNFTENFIRDNEKHQIYMETILNRSDFDNEKIYAAIKNQLNKSDYDYMKIFVGDGVQMPYWAGYSLGYYLVKKYLAKTGKTVENAFVDKYRIIESVIYC